MASSQLGMTSSGEGVARQRGGSKMKLKFTNSTAALLEGHAPDHTPSSTTRRFMASRAAAALQLHRARIHSLSQRLALWFLVCLALLLAWTIGYFNASPALLVLLGIAAVAIGTGRWQQVVEGAGLEAELRARQKMRSHVVGESVEWLNVALNKWWNRCDDTVLYFLKDHVESLVKDILPGAIDKIEVVGVDLGGQTPSLSNVRLQDAPPTVGVASEGANITSMVATFDVVIPAPDARITLRATIGGKTLSSSHLAYIESLYVRGTLQAMLVFDNQLPFPHISKITGTFVSRPDIWFSVRVLRGVRVMEIPLLRNWVHSLVMDVFTTLLVDPGKLTFNLDQSKKEHASAAITQGSLAKGVVMVTVSGRPPARATKKDVSPGRYITLRLSNKKYEWSLKPGNWQAKYAFLVYDLEQEMLVLKVKQRKLLHGSTLSVHSTSLASLGLASQPGESPDERVVNYGSSENQFTLHLSYTGLPQISLQEPTTQIRLLPHQNAGVLYVHIHDGVGLKAADSNGLSDPYCVVMANKQQILKTDYVAGTLHPTWDTAVEVLVADMEQVVLMFAVFDYDGPMAGDDFLGVAKLPLSLTNPSILQQTLALRDLGSDSSDSDSSLGSITVSVVIRPVASVGEVCPSCLVSGKSAHFQEEAMMEEGNSARRRSVNWSTRKKSKKRDRKREAALRESDEEDYEAEPVMEVRVLKGRDLVPKDSNGLSDPYVVIKYGSQVMFRSSVIKKTLNPHWAESATLTAPSSDDIIYVECWDKDMFSDDYMGSMTFTYSDITSLFSGKPRWCKLQHVKHGELLLHMSLHRDRGRSQDDERSDEVQWSHLDEASRQLVGQVELREDERVGGVVKMNPGIGIKEEESGESMSSSSGHSGHHRDSSSETALSFTSGHTGPGSSSAPTFSPGHTSTSSAELIKPVNIKRRHTLSHHGVSMPSEIYRKYEDTTDPSHLPRYPETTADINRALMQSSTDGGPSGGNRSVVGTDRPSYKEKVLTMFHNISGQVIEASGLKGNLDHMELYVKVRLNTRPSYQRQHKFARGPVVHKTRNLRGSHNPQWMEDFVVKESPVPSDSLLTLDLKSGSKVNIGTYVITLDKFLEGQLKSTRTLDIGNDMKLKVKISRQLPIVQQP